MVYVKRKHVPTTFDLDALACLGLARPEGNVTGLTSQSPDATRELRSRPRGRGRHFRDMPQENAQMDRQVIYIQQRPQDDLFRTLYCRPR